MTVSCQFRIRDFKPKNQEGVQFLKELKAYYGRGRFIVEGPQKAVTWPNIFPLLDCYYQRDRAAAAELSWYRREWDLIQMASPQELNNSSFKEQLNKLKQETQRIAEKAHQEYAKAAKETGLQLTFREPPMTALECIALWEQIPQTFAASTEMDEF